jgi:hypothetical protein
LRRQRTGRDVLEARIATDCPSFFQAARVER